MLRGSLKKAKRSILLKDEQYFCVTPHDSRKKRETSCHQVEDEDKINTVSNHKRTASGIQVYRHTLAESTSKIERLNRNKASNYIYRSSYIDPAVKKKNTLTKPVLLNKGYAGHTHSSKVKSNISDNASQQRLSSRRSRKDRDSSNSKNHCYRKTADLQQEYNDQAQELYNRLGTLPSQPQRLSILKKSISVKTIPKKDMRPESTGRPAIVKDKRDHFRSFFKNI